MDNKRSATSCGIYHTDELSRYLVDSLPPRRRKRIAAHLAVCPHCAQRVRELLAVRSLLRHAPDIALPHSFTLADEAARAPRRRLWYPVLRTATTAVATLVLLLLLGGALQPRILTVSPPTPRPVVFKPTPLIAPTPLPVAIAPASTSRPRSTDAPAAPAIAGAPTAESPAYPRPAESRPYIAGTVTKTVGTTPVQTAASPNTALWSAVHLGGLALLSLLAGLTWRAYRRERVFFF